MASNEEKPLDEVSFGLKDLLSVLRAEISQAVADVESDKPEITFNLGEIEVELQTVITKEGGANGKIKVLAFEAGANGKYSSAQTQKIKIKLDVTDEKGGKKQVSRTERIK